MKKQLLRLGSGWNGISRNNNNNSNRLGIFNLEPIRSSSRAMNEAFDRLRLSKLNQQQNHSSSDDNYGGGVEHEIEINQNLVKYRAGVTTPRDLMKAGGLSGKKRKQTLISRLDKKEWLELDEPIPQGEYQSLEFLSFDEGDDVKHIFWHSSAHILGLAMQEHFGHDLQLVDGPSLEKGGFFYEAHMDEPIRDGDLEEINKICRRIVGGADSFQKLTVSKEEALSLFQDNPFKIEVINNLPEGAIITVYKTGNLIDLCRGPHIDNTKHVGGMEIQSQSGVYYKGNKDNVQLQRVYGISFPNPKQLKIHKKHMEEMKKRDHRVIGQNQKLWIFQECSPGTPFFLDHGTRMINKLVEMMRLEYRKRGFQEVITPQMYNKDLWKLSGHWDYYKDDMFLIDEDGGVLGDEDSIPSSSSTAAAVHGGDTIKDDSSEVVLEEKTLLDEPHQSCGHRDTIMGLKPMNCPGHCLIFKSQQYSYKDLPVRMADFSPLHRNELRGALSGLTRVRRFVQDDAHIFTRHDQIQSELDHALQFVKDIYKRFDLKVSFVLSTRPDKYQGELEQWNHAESVLKQCLDQSELPWTLNEGDGAFYGPKIDIKVQDSLGRSHQCATIQLDFQLPKAFELKYKTAEDTTERPVMIHRAILGSLERFLAIITEHYAGRWPLWISPRQIKIVPVSPDLLPYAQQVADQLHSKYYVDVAAGKERLNKKIRNAQLDQYNFILVVGKQEQEAGDLVNVRTRSAEVLGTMTIDELDEKLKGLIERFE